MEGAVLDPGVEAGKAGAARLAFLELRLIVCHMLRIRPVVLRGRHRRGGAFRAGHPKPAFRGVVHVGDEEVSLAYAAGCPFDILRSKYRNPGRGSPRSPDGSLPPRWRCGTGTNCGCQLWFINLQVLGAVIRVTSASLAAFVSVTNLSLTSCELGTADPNSSMTDRTTQFSSRV